MKLLSIIFAILIFGTAFAQEPLKVRGLGGLVTRVGDFATEGNHPRGLHNITLDEVGSWKKRKGYDVILSIPGLDSILGIYAAQYSDSSTEMIIVTDPDSIGYSHIIKWDDSTNFNITDTIRFIDGGAYTAGTLFLLPTTNGESPSQLVFTTGAEGVESLNDIAGRVKDSVNIDEAGWASIYTITLDTSGVDTAMLVVAHDANGGEPISMEMFFTDSITLEVKSVYTATTGLTNIYSYWSPQANPTFAMLQDVVYIANGRQKVLAWNKDLMSQVPMNTSGEPTVVPIDIHSTQDTNTFFMETGEYYYTFVGVAVDNGTSPDSTIFTLPGVISNPVRVDSGRVLLTDFVPIRGDSNLVTANLDSFYVYIYRSSSNPYPISLEDSLKLVGRVGTNSIATLTSAIFFDSVASGNYMGGDLGALTHAGVDSIYPFTDSMLVPTGRTDSTETDLNTYQSRRYGALTFESAQYFDSTTDTTFVGGVVDSIGVYWGWADLRDTIGYAYVCVLIDTTTESRSDTARALFVFKSADTSDAYYTMTLPYIPIPLGVDTLGIQIEIYRAPIRTTTHDSTYTESTDLGYKGDSDACHIYCITKERDRYTECFTDCFETGVITLEGQDRVADSFYVDPLDYRRVAILASTVETFTDSIRYDSLYDHGTLEQNPFLDLSDRPRLLGSIFPFEENLGGTYKSTLYLSDLRRGQEWDATNNVSFNKQDGQSITLAYYARSVIRIYKKTRNYNLFQDANLNYSRTEVSGYFGCIAPSSHGSGLQGHYYLSEDGVIKETEGSFRERSYGITLLSENLDNFDKLDVTTKSQGVGVYFDHKYILSISDTSYVYDEIGKGWSTWSLTFGGTTQRNDSLFFFKPGGSDINVYGTSEFDGGNNIQIAIKSHLLFLDDGVESIKRFGLWRKGSDTTSSLFLSVYNSNDSLMKSATFTDLNKRVSYEYIGVNNAVSPYFILGSSPFQNLNTTIINGFDIYYRIIDKEN